MLYNWDDMHIFSSAFPKKIKMPGWHHFVLGEAELVSNRCWNTKQHLATFIHHLFNSHSPTMLWGTKQRPLPVGHATGLEASKPNGQICCYIIIYLDIKEYMGTKT